MVTVSCMVCVSIFVKYVYFLYMEQFDRSQTLANTVHLLPVLVVSLSVGLELSDGARTRIQVSLC